MTRTLSFALSFVLLLFQVIHAEDVNTELMKAAFNGDTMRVKNLLSKGANANANKNGWTALMAAAVAGHTDTLEVLLAKGANVNAQANDGLPPSWGQQQEAIPTL